MLRLRTQVRRELVFLALGVIDVCVITPLFGALLWRIVAVRQVSLLGILLGAVMGIHYLARFAMWLPLHPSQRWNWVLRSGLLMAGMSASGLVVVHRLLHAHTRLLSTGWLVSTFRGLGNTNPSHDVIVFLLVLFLWWRGVVLAQRRLDSESVAFRFRLSLVFLAVTTVLGGLVLDWAQDWFVFIFFFASLLGIALARAEEVGQQYGGSQSPFDLRWLVTLISASLAVLLLSAGVAALLTGENVSRFLGPVWNAVSVVAMVLFMFLVYVLGFLTQVLVAILRLFVREIDLSLLSDLTSLVPPAFEVEPEQARFTAEQLEMMRRVGVGVGLLLLILLVVFSLRRLRAGAGRKRDEERESVWEGSYLRDGLRDVLRQGRGRLDDVIGALGRSVLGRFFAARTIRRIYAHLSALAAEQGYPRAAYETPYEYLPTLKQAFPENGEDVMCITKAYVAVHYGEVPERLEELVAVQHAWERIREEEARS